MALSPGPVVALNRGLAVAELRGLDAGRAALASLTDNPQLAQYSFFWAAVADIERRSGRTADARTLYHRAVALARSRAERVSYERRLRNLEN
jgi:RNA polymerase sigma-70 factor (ECF subfamily)